MYFTTFTYQTIRTRQISCASSGSIHRRVLLGEFDYMRTVKEGRYTELYQFLAECMRSSLIELASCYQEADESDYCGYYRQDEDDALQTRVRHGLSKLS